MDGEGRIEQTPVLDTRINSKVAATTGLHLSAFDMVHADEIARWVATDAELLWLAPSTKPPLTPDKVVAWRKPRGHAYILSSGHDPQPMGYGELNPMRKEPAHLWIGHVLVRPELRGRGLGLVITRALLDEAFGRFGADRVSLVVFPENLPALRCYRASGFRVVRTEYHQFNDTGPRRRLLRLEAVSPDDQSASD